MTKIYRETIQLKEAELFYYDTEEEKPVIICLHGLYGRAETWSDFISHYGEKYRILAPDFRGHGRSSKPDGYYTMDEMGEDIAEMLQKLKIKTAIFVGHSMGGAVAGYLAATYPKKVKAVAILDKTAKGPEKHMPRLASQIKEEDVFTGNWKDVFDTRKEAIQCIEASSESELETQYFINSLIEEKSGYRFLFSKKAVAAYRANYCEWMELLFKIKCPTLFVKSAGEETTSSQDLEEMKICVNKAVLYTMASENHNVHLSDPEEFYKIFDLFLEKEVLQFSLMRTM